MGDLKLRDNEKAGQYEIHVNGQVAKLEYKKTTDKLYLLHTEVPDSLKGQGVGSALVRQVLEKIRQDGAGKTLVARCPFVAAYLKRHPSWLK